MNIDRILIEYAKVSLQLIQANDMIAQLQAQLKAVIESQKESQSANNADSEQK